MLATAVLLAWPAIASGHVELRPKRASAGERELLRLEVENERDAAATEKIDVRLPAGVAAVSPRPPSGWTSRVRGSRLTFSARSDAAKIDGHRSKRFAFAADLPAVSRGRLTFKVLQTYDSGEVVRWIGPPDSEEPAARLRLSAPRTKRGPTDKAAANDTSAPAESEGDDGGGGGASSSLVTILAAVAFAALALGAILRSRRKRRRSRQA